MVVWRRWIFPILMVIVVGAGAAALVKIAFFPDQAPAAALEPSAQIADPVVVVEKGEVVNALSLDGTIARMPPTRSAPAWTASSPRSM